MAEKIEKCKGRDSEHLSSLRSIVDTVIICGFCYNDRGRCVIAELYDCIVIGDGSALPILHLNQNILSVWIIDNNVDLLVFLAAAEIANKLVNNN